MQHMQWTTTSAAATAQGAKMLVYGESGQGKTILCATLPRPCILSAEAGLLSLSRQNLERLFGVGHPDISYDTPVIQIRNVGDLENAYAYFANSAEARQHFSSLALDSVSEIAEVVLANAKAQVKDPRQAYGEVIEKTLMLVRKFRDLAGYNFYMSAKMELMKDETSGIVKYMPSMPGSKLGQQLPYFVDEVFRLGTNKTPAPESRPYRFLQTEGDLQYVAKDRSGLLAPIEEPNLSHIIRKITGVTR